MITGRIRYLARHAACAGIILSPFIGIAAAGVIYADVIDALLPKMNSIAVALAAGVIYQIGIMLKGPLDYLESKLSPRYYLVKKNGQMILRGAMSEEEKMDAAAYLVDRHPGFMIELDKSKYAEGDLIVMMASQARPKDHGTVVSRLYDKASNASFA
jgi:hypothetical protein